MKQLGQSRLSSEGRGGGERGQQAPLQSLTVTRGGDTGLNAAREGSRERRLHDRITCIAHMLAGVGVGLL